MTMTTTKTLPPKKKKSKSEPRADKSLRRRIENIKRQKIVGKKVVSLADFRELRQEVEVRNVLVVDDDEVMRNGLKRILENDGFRVELAKDGLELSQKLETIRLDIILLDVNLPWVDGFELCRLIKEHPSLRNVPLIMISARKAKEDIDAGFAAGCDEYVTKPFDVDYISGVIQKALSKVS